MQLIDVLSAEDIAALGQEWRALLEVMLRFAESKRARIKWVAGGFTVELEDKPTYPRAESDT